jgi:hypothetical protein
MPRPRKNKRYFTKITEIAINAYNKCDNQYLKNKIYNRFIHYPFDKLSENVIHTYKTYYFDDPYEDIKANVVAFLNEKIDRFDGANGRAFSYFTVVARNYLFNENNKNYERMRSRDDVDALDLNRNVINEVITQQNREEKSDFIDYYVKYIDIHLYELFLKDRDRAVADSINELFRNRVDLYSYNKKALYILIRERTGVDTQYITKVINKMKSIYGELYYEYNQNGFLSMSYELKEEHG